MNNKSFLVEKQRKLEEDFQPIRIHIESQCLLDYFYGQKLSLIKDALEIVKNTVKTLIKVQRFSYKSIISKDIPLGNGFTDTCVDWNTLNAGVEADLIIFITVTDWSEDPGEYGKVEIIKKIDDLNDNRPFIGKISHNFKSMLDTSNNDDFFQQLKIIFLHQFIHILGFRKDILQRKNFIFSASTKNRWNDVFSQRTFINSTKMTELAKKYYNEDNFEGFEIEEYSDDGEGEDNIHYHPRLLLGEIMSHKSYYIEQYISEFTLALLEDLGWYQINYYTGGLMRFGKNQGNQFFTSDCVKLIPGTSNDINSTFPNEFCSHIYEGDYNTFGMCSPGRQSMSYCFGEVNSRDIENNYKRSYNSKYFGRNYIEYCPISDGINANAIPKPEYYKGSCNIGKGRFGKYMTYKDTSAYTYNSFNGSFWDIYSNESFCALSSILKKNVQLVKDELFEKIDGLIRPTCYKMFCSERSLTIQIDKEYFVCPREGGILEINNKWTQYYGILYCPDYNLICTGTEVCNDIFSCVEKKSKSKLVYGNFTYDYNKKDISMSLKNNMMDSEMEKLLVIGFEEDEEGGKCPRYCQQCNENHQCTLCYGSHPYYIGTKENDTNPIKCIDKDPSEGYYKTTKYIPNKTFYFKCIDNCLICEEISKNECLECEPTHYIKDGHCVERIPGCKNYDTIHTQRMPDNGNRVSYIYCDDCNNTDGYYCFNMNKSTCIRMEDYNMTLNLSLYYNMENKEYSCIERCDEKFNGGCETCNISTCTKCYDNNRLINYQGNCIESIDNCNIQDLSVEYKRCIQCDYQNNYYCFKENRTECIYIPNQNITSYYKIENNYDSCVDLCVEKYQSHCLECNNVNCTKCEEGFYIHKGQCIENMTGCIDNYFVDSNNQTECNLCDSNLDYYCINKNKTICNIMNLTTLSLYYKLPNIDYPCYHLCHEKYPNCINCTSEFCYKCSNEYIINRNKSKCLILPQYLDEKEACTIKYFEYNDSLEQSIDFFSLAKNYFESVNSTNVVHHYTGNNFSIIIYINSDCTEGLLNEGYFSIDTNELNHTMVIESDIELLRHTIGIYVNYNFKSHLRFHDFEFYYLNPKIYCPSCYNITYTMKYNLYNIIKEIYNQPISSLILNENLDVFDSELDIYTDPCYNVTFNGIDMPIHLRKNYLYIDYNYTKILLCRDIDCDLIEYNIETRTSTCKCKMENEYDYIFIENGFNIFQYKEEIKAKGFSESVKVIKCTNNGFKYISTSFGIIMSIIILIIQIILYVIYCYRGKSLANLSKPLIANPPKEEKSTKIYLYSDWELSLDNNENKLNQYNEEVKVQSRDESEEQIFEEEKSFYKDELNFSNVSINTNEGGLFPGKHKNRNLKIFETNKKVLILIGNKTQKRDNLEQSVNKDMVSEESDEQPLEKSIKYKNISFLKNYWLFLSIKQHIIHYFSYIRCCKMTESYIPLYIRFIRSLFIICLSFLVNIVWLDPIYYEKKFNYFNNKYGITNPSNNNDINISLNERFSYAFSHSLVYGLIGIIFVTLCDFIIGYFFFNIRDEVTQILIRNKTSKMQDMILKARKKYNIFFVINIILIIIFLLSFAGFEASYQGGAVDYFAAGFFTLILNEILPFIWSLILALFRYYGIKKKNKYMYKFSEFFFY